ncbi:hypothetical protein SKAU_G00094230 [Synaphobranchus kaupii]|uniref:Uncharacterized protein n=1 Tax=Synaphobranchus kaupii TaxID=118154 RepID=A0A9Q1FXA3_SYNKA|nr:hypothetical protein SKAU_G00094230 [Synaphobranchus kaupii]
MDRTPKETEELVLLQAGMGRRTITLPEGAEHFEPDADFIMSSCAVVDSEKGSARERAEVEIIKESSKCMQPVRRATNFASPC